MDEEGTDKVLRAAEMEATKASNLLTHREEIMSRPARTWFQSSNERAAAKELAPRTARAAVGGEGGEAGEGAAELPDNLLPAQLAPTAQTWGLTKTASEATGRQRQH